MKQRLAILGSTGSIGVQTLDIVRETPSLFEVRVLTANIRNGNFGVRIAAAASDRITAIDNGTVVLSLWTPETGYMVELQHANNLLSVYKGLSQSLVTTGQTIRAGEMVGYNAEAEEGEVRLFEFELWNNGKPVDPEGYIVF